MAYGEFGGATSAHTGETFIVDELLHGDEAGYAKGPERTLMAALLFDGLQSYMSYVCAATQAAKTRYREAYNWVTSDDTEYVFSFVNVCEALGIHPQFLRIGLISACTVQLV